MNNDHILFHLSNNNWNREDTSLLFKISPDLLKNAETSAKKKEGEKGKKEKKESSSLP